MRDVLTALAALVAIALLALMVGPHFVDWNGQKLRVSEAFKGQTGIETRIGGALRITLLPTPELDVEDIEFGPIDAPIARIGRLTVLLSPMALLRGRIAVNSARADRSVFSRSAIGTSLEASTGSVSTGSDRLAQIGIERLSLKSTRFVERIEPGAPPPAGSGALDIEVEAPSLAGPFRVHIHDPAQGRDINAHFGQLEKGRARLKALFEDKRLATRISFDGWFAVPGIAGRPIFDGAASFNGNPVVPGTDGVQLPFQGTARVIAHADQAIVDPVNLALGSGENALQLAGQGFFDFKSARPVVHIKLAAKRFDAQPHLATEAAQRGGAAPGGTRAAGSEVGAQGRRGVLPADLTRVLYQEQAWVRSLPLDIGLDLAVEAVQVPGALIKQVALNAMLRSGKMVIDTLSAELPGATRASFRRAVDAKDVPIDGRLEVDSENFQTLVGWVRGAEHAVDLPASATLSARLTSATAGVGLKEIRIASPAGALDGTGELLPAEPGKRALPKLVLDLAGERFDARVLAALDPLRPVPGVELATHLAVRKLTLDGQELGGLEVSLDRDGATATLRQLRLTGRKGEEVMLSGTASGDAIQLTAKLDAERLGDIARLASALLPGAATEAILKRATLLEPAIAVASFRIETKSGDAVWDVAVDGKLGGTVLKGRGQSSFTGADLSVQIEGDFANPDGGRLAGQIFGVPTPASQIPGQLTIKAKGNPRRLISGSATAALAGVDMTFDGGLNLFRANPLEGRFTLRSGDLAELGAALGGGAPVLKQGLSASAKGRLFTERAKVTLTGLDAKIGDDPVSGEVSFDLARAGQIAGQLRMATIALPSLLAPAIGRAWPQGDEGWSRAAFAPPLPPLVSGDLWIEAKRAVLVEGIVLDAPQFVLRFSPGSVAIDGFEAKAGEARIAGAVSLLRKAEKLVVGGQIDFARIPLSGLSGGPGGRLAGTAPFSAEGDNPFDLVSTLSGAGRMTLDDLVIRAGDPQALPRVVAIPLDDLAPINENRVGALVERELQRGDLRIASATWPVSLLNGQIRIGGAAQTAADAREIMVTPTILVDLVRREAEARFAYAQTQLPKDWRGAVPEISLVLSMRHGGRSGKAGEDGIRRTLQVSSLVNGFLAMSIQRDLERAEAFDADIREREAQLRRQRGDAFMARRLHEIHEFEQASELEAIQLRRRIEAAVELERQREMALRLEHETKEREAREREAVIPRAPAASGAPLDLAPKGGPVGGPPG